VLAIRDGRVKLTVVSPEGRDVVLAVKAPGELLGEFAALDGRPRSATAVALERVEGVVVDAGAFAAFLEEHPSVSALVLRQLTGQLRRVAHDWVDREGVEVVVRVARRLVDLAERFGEHNGTTVVIRIGITQDDLAGWVGATREATNRALGVLRRERCLQTGRQHLVITDLERLVELAS
jgi:CRP-like cAMP-binding protein